MRRQQQKPQRPPATGRNRTLAVDLAGSGPLAGLKRPLGGLKCGDAGLRQMCAGRPGMQHINAASCQQGSVEGLRTSSAGSEKAAADVPLDGQDDCLQHVFDQGNSVKALGSVSVLGVAVVADVPVCVCELFKGSRGVCLLGVRAARTLGAVVGCRILFRLLSGSEETAKMVCADKADVERQVGAQ